MFYKEPKYPTVQLAIVDNFPLYRRGITQLMSLYEDIQIHGEYSNGKQFLKSIEESNQIPEVVLINLHLPGMNGVELCREVQQLNLGTQVIHLSNYDDSNYVENVFHYGSKAFLLKNSSSDEIHKAIHVVNEGGIYYNEVFTPDRVQQYQGKDYKIDRDRVFPDFELREQRVIDLICQECNDQEIKDRLGITESTLEQTKNHIMKKMGVRSTVGIAIFALQHGIIAD